MHLSSKAVYQQSTFRKADAKLDSVKKGTPAKERASASYIYRHCTYSLYYYITNNTKDVPLQTKAYPYRSLFRILTPLIQTVFSTLKQYQSRDGYIVHQLSSIFTNKWVPMRFYLDIKNKYDTDERLCMRGCATDPLSRWSCFFHLVLTLSVSFTVAHIYIIILSFLVLLFQICFCFK